MFAWKKKKNPKYIRSKSQFYIEKCDYRLLIGVTESRFVNCTGNTKVLYRKIDFSRVFDKTI